MISSLLRSDEDLEAFCLDYFPELYKRFGRGMERTEKADRLVSHAAPGALLMRLRERFQEDAGALQTIEHVLSDPKTQQEQQTHAQWEQLEVLYLQREELLNKGQSVAEVDREIVALKRLQRRGPEVVEGEVFLNRYRLIEPVGSGGFGWVWRAFDRVSRQSVAVKILHGDEGDDSSRLERFERGARQMRSLRHEHIVRVLDGPGEHSGFHFFVMEYFPRGDLHHAITSGQMAREQALACILQVGDALADAHGRGLIHRDIKPQNILIDAQGYARLTDFDLVWAQDTTGGTRTTALGTFLYAAPEEMEDASRVDARADVYALAMTTVFVLHGKSLTRRVLDARGAFIEALGCGQAIKALLLRATSPEPQTRPASAQAFCSELEQALAAGPEPSVSTALPLAHASHPPLPAVPEQARASWTRRLSVGLLVGLVITGAAGGAYVRLRSGRASAEQPAAAKAMLSEAENNLTERRWKDAIAQFDRILALPSPAVTPEQRKKAEALRAIAETEAKNQQTFDAFLRAERAGQYDVAITSYKQLPEGSAYWLLGRADFERVLPLFIADHIKQAAGARAAGRCQEAASHVQTLLDVNPAQPDALRAKALPCPPISSETSEPPREQEPEPSPRAARTAVQEGELKPDSVVKTHADEVLTEAQSNFVNGNYKLAIQQARAVARDSPVRAWRIIGGAACHMLDVPLANESYRHLDAPGRQYMIYVCQREGMMNQGSQFKLAE